MKISIVGCGNMGSCFAQKLSENHELVLFDKHEEKSRDLAKKLKVSHSSKLDEAVKDSEIVILAIKPKDLQDLSNSLTVNENQCVVSMLSGMLISELKEFLGEEISIARIMPNTPIRFGSGVIGVSYEGLRSEGKKERVHKLLEELGLVIELDEALIDAITPLSGCGPAFVFLIMEAFTEAGIALGFRSQEALNIAIQTVEGSIKLLKESKEIPTVLKLQVTSPKGDTIRGLLEMERKGLKSALIDGIIAAKP